MNTQRRRGSGALLPP